MSIAKFRYKNVLKGITFVLALSALFFSPLKSTVFAEGGLEVEIIKVTQNGNELEILNSNGDLHVATDDYEHEFNVQAKVKNATPGRKYYINTNEDTQIEWTADNGTETTINFSAGVSYTSDTRLSVDAWAVWEKDKEDEWAYTTVTVDINNENFHRFGSPEVLGVSQNGTVITPVNKDGVDVYTVNSVERVAVRAKFSSVMDDRSYYVYMQSNNEDVYYENGIAGSELKNGHEFVMSMDNYEDNILTYCVEEGRNTDCREIEGISIKPVEDESVGRFSAELKYINYPNKSVIGSDGYSYVSPLYHDSNNPLGVKIEGQKYDNSTNYNVRIKVEKELPVENNRPRREVIKVINTTVSGAELNGGKLIEITDFAMEFMDKNNLMYDWSYGSVSIEIGGVFKRITVDFGYKNFKSVVLYENGMQSAPGDGVGGVCNELGRLCLNGYMAHINVVGGAYLYYTAVDFDETKDFGYELYYMDEVPYGKSELDQNKILKSGNISGKELNSGRLGFKLENPNNYSEPTYVLLVTNADHDKVIAIVSDTLTLWDGVGIVSHELSSEQAVYMKMAGFSYSAVKGANVNVRLKGIGFKSSTKYKVKISGEKDTGSGFNEDDKITPVTKEFTGKDLNDGKATITIKYPNNTRAIWTNISIESSGDSRDFVGSLLHISYVDLNDILSNNAGYSIDNAKVALKDVKKKTSVSDFLSKVDLTGAGSMKIFDKTGKNEITGTVGTGMIMRIYDEYNRITNDIGIAVKGDTSGDGNVSVLDLVKASRHLAGIEKLSGLYEMAGSVTGTGSLRLLDLVKAARDVAGLEEL